MKVSAAVGAVAVVLIVGSLTMLTGIVVEFASAVDICHKTGQPWTSLLTLRVAALAFLPAVFNLLGLTTAVGLLFAREWGRRTALFLAVAPFVVYLPVVFFRPVIVFPRETSGGLLVVGDLGYPLCVYSLLLMAPLSLWWLILLTRDRVRSQFQ